MPPELISVGAAGRAEAHNDTQGAQQSEMGTTAATTPEAAHAILAAAGYEAVEPFPGNVRTKWKIRCLAAGHESFRPTSTIRPDGRKCAGCTADDAVALLVERGFEPLEPYPGGTNKKWRMRCLAAGHEVAPLFSAIKSGVNGCDGCTGRAKTTESEALAIISAAGYEPIDPYPGKAIVPWRMRCLAAGHEVAPKLAVVKLGHGCAGCSRNALVTEAEAVAEIAAAGFEPIDPYVKASEPWRMRCIAERHEVAPQLTSIRMGKGCAGCASNVPVPESEALAVITAAGFEAVEPYPGGTNKKWRMRCIAAGHETSPSLSRIKDRGSRCGLCVQGWTARSIIALVRAMQPHLGEMTGAEWWALASAAGITGSGGLGPALIGAIVDGHLTRPELNELLDGIDEVSDPSDTATNAIVDVLTDKRIAPSGGHYKDERAEVLADDGRDTIRAAGTPVGDLLGMFGHDEDDEFEAPTIADELSALGAASEIAAKGAGDTEQIETMIALKTSSLWRRVFAATDIEAITAELRAVTGNGYVDTIRGTFLAELDGAATVEIPADWEHKFEPNLMQRLTAFRSMRDGTYGNWSGTGGGKTLAAVFAAAHIGSEYTVILCPNNVVPAWTKEITEAFPNAEVSAKSWKPAPWMVLNVDMLSADGADQRIARLVDQIGDRIGLLVLDEVHLLKNRYEEDISSRREAAMAFRANLPNAAVIGQTATPLVNNLREVHSMFELITGQECDLPTPGGVKPPTDVVMMYHRELVRIGHRYVPQLEQALTTGEQVLDCTDDLDELRCIPKGDVSRFEAALIRMKMPIILDEVRKGTVIYSYFVDGIVDRLAAEVRKATGLSVGVATGSDMSGWDVDSRGNPAHVYDVLIASSAISTGVDGLQHHYDKLIVAVAPWTAAEYAQLVGRVHRQGSTFDSVEVVLPVADFTRDSDGKTGSWDRVRFNRIAQKRTLADAVVDGVLPAANERTQGQALGDYQAWLDRIEEGRIIEPGDPARIVIPLPEITDEQIKRRGWSRGEFLEMNRRRASEKSSTTHAALQRDPQDWYWYHREYREQAKDWSVDPISQVAEWLRARSGYTVADLGCGLGALVDEVGARHDVRAFDHVSCRPEVLACDIAAGVPMVDGEADVTVLSLVLSWGTNSDDYLSEAARLTRVDGTLLVWDTEAELGDESKAVARFEAAGFERVTHRRVGNFIEVVATRSA